MEQNKLKGADNLFSQRKTNVPEKIKDEKKENSKEIQNIKKNLNNINNDLNNKQNEYDNLVNQTIETTTIFEDLNEQITKIKIERIKNWLNIIECCMKKI